jgi:GSH-dependent disulfide-bond oxidoreductase
MSYFTVILSSFRIRPTAGSRVEANLPRGDARFQLYSLATPNGQKPAILLEELGIDYDAHSTYIDPFFDS